MRASIRALCAAAGDFYIRKDFDPKVGLTVVIIGALISAVFYWFGEDLIAYSILGGAALIDLFVYGRLGDVTVCYRCHSEFRGKYPAHRAALRSAYRGRPGTGIRAKNRAQMIERRRQAAAPARHVSCNVHVRRIPHVEQRRSQR